MDLPPHLLDNEIRRAAAAVRVAREELRRGGPGAAPTVSPLEDERRVSSRSTYLELGERAGDPLMQGLQAWVFVLTLDRVCWADERRLAGAWHEASIKVEAPSREELSPRALFGRVLADPSQARRRLWADALARGASQVADAARILAERRAEAARRLDAQGPDRIEVPIHPPETAASIAASVAGRFLDETAGMVELRESDSWDEVIARSMARGATSGWPAKLGSRWIEDQLRSARGLTEGLSIDLGRLPEPLGAASFARTLARFGRAFAEASIPPSSPFSLARPPLDLRVERRAALFGGLLSDPVFGARSLGLGRDRARAQAREIAVATLLSLRMEAARVRLRGALLLPERARRALVEEETARALGAPLPSSLLGVIPSLGPEDTARFLGALLSATDRRSLIARFDDDWFRNPHAAEALRGEQSTLPPSARATKEALDEGLADITRAFAEHLG